MKMLFLEKIIKSAACAGGTNGGASGIVCFTFNGSSGDEMRAFGANVFLGNSLQNWLRALELGTRIEMSAILAAAKVGTAFGTLAALGNFDGFRHNRAAHCATQ